MKTVTERILGYLLVHPRATRGDLVRGLGLGYYSVNAALGALHVEGKVVRLGRGVYALPDKEEPQ